MIERDQAVQQLQLLAQHRRTLANALGQLALVGGAAYASLALLNSIDETSTHIANAKAWLREQGAAVDDEPNDLAAQQLRARTSVLLQRSLGDTPLGTRVVLGRFTVGLSALRALIEQVPQIRDSAVEFHTIFLTACEQINTLRAYKSLHDQLHEIQFRCLEQIERELARFPALDGYDMNFEEYAANLEQAIVALREVVADTPTLKPAPSWIDQLVLAHRELLLALPRQDADLLRNATSKIRRVLSRYPSLINVHLTVTVRGMRLARLVEIMNYIYDTCASFEVDPIRVARIAAGLGALRELDTHLTALSNDHDQWQSIDNLLRMLSDSQDTVVDAWSELKHEASPLYERSEEPWARDLRDSAMLLDQAMRQNDQRSIQQQFQNYRRRAMQQFYRVDKQLKKLCEKLDHINGPFAFVIEVLE